MSKNEYNEFYLECISDTLNYALKEYPRITVIRVDLHFPPIIDNGDMPTCFPYLEGSPISRFTDSLKAKLKHDQHRKEVQGKRTFENNMRYMWVKEIATATLPHYHVFLVFNKDAYYHLGDYNLFEPSLTDHDHQSLVQCITARIRPYYRYWSISTLPRKLSILLK